MGKDQGVGVGATDPLTRARGDVDPQWSVPPTAVLLESWDVDQFFGEAYGLPRDLTIDSWPTCTEEPWGGWRCTRLPGHTGRHAAGDGTVILAVWP